MMRGGTMMRGGVMMRRKQGVAAKLWLGVFGGMTIFALWAAPAAAQIDELGGHFGVVFPLATWEDGQKPATINEDFVIGFPMGITVKKSGPLAFDLEFVPTINNHDVELTVHPGVLYDLGNSFTAGLRMAFDVRQDSWGFTPLINRKLCDVTETSHLFVEIPVPIRFKQDSTSVTAALHLGIGF